MIPLATYLQQWSNRATWPDLRHVEQDLIVRIIVRIKGAQWKLTAKVIEALRQGKYPGLLTMNPPP